MALRNLWRNKSFSIINIGGLGLGLAASSLLFMLVTDELGFDDHHGKSDRIFRVIDEHHSTTGQSRQFAYTMPPLGPALARDFPEVENYARLGNFGRYTVRTESAWYYEGDHYFTDPSFFSIFDFEFISGNPRTALVAPNSVVLTESTADKYFGAADPYGKVLNVPSLADLKVTGIIRDTRPNSHLNFSMLISMSTIVEQDGSDAYMRRWDGNYFTTYILLDNQKSAAKIAPELVNLSARYRGEDAWAVRSFALQPLTDIHFGSADIGEYFNKNKGNIFYVYLFSAVAFFTLLVAIINYTNLATAQFLSRAKEVGVRKSVGAYRTQIVAQFILESMLFTLIAAILAIVLIEMILPSFNTFTGKSLGLDMDSIRTPLILVGSVVLVSFVAGAYPALYHSRFPTSGVLTGDPGGIGSSTTLRRALVVLQFAMCIVLIVSTLIVNSQLGFVREKWLGFDQEHLITVDINSGNARKAFREMKAEFAQWSTVKNVSVSSRLPGDWKSIASIEVYPGRASLGEPTAMNFIGVDEDFLTTYDIELLTGRDFIVGNAADSAAVIINETVANLFGWVNPVGKEISVPDEKFIARVIGVVKDFHFKSLHENIGPMILGNWNNPIQRIDYFTLRITGEDMPGTLAHIKRTNEAIDTATPVEINFLDDRLNRFYAMDQMAGALFRWGAILALLIAALGMYGLATFTARRRIKEIGIRKVLGASVSSIVQLLSSEFTKLVLLANFMAWPVAWWAMNRWLDNFAYRVEMGPMVYLFAGLVAFAIALISVGVQAMKAATANPVDSLRYE